MIEKGLGITPTSSTPFSTVGPIGSSGIVKFQMIKLLSYNFNVHKMKATVCSQWKHTRGSSLGNWAAQSLSV